MSKNNQVNSKENSIRIKISGFDHTQVDRAAKEVLETAKNSGANTRGPIPLPVKISLKHGSKAPIPISFLSTKDLKVFSIVSALKDSMEFNSEKNSLTREIELFFHFFLNVL